MDVAPAAVVGPAAMIDGEFVRGRVIAVDVDPQRDVIAHGEIGVARARDGGGGGVDLRVRRTVVSAGDDFVVVEDVEGRCGYCPHPYTTPAAVSCVYDQPSAL